MTLSRPAITEQPRFSAAPCMNALTVHRTLSLPPLYPPPTPLRYYRCLLADSLSLSRPTSAHLAYAIRAAVATLSRSLLRALSPLSPSRSHSLPCAILPGTVLCRSTLCNRAPPSLSALSLSPSFAALT